ncbi:HAMP domain-containing protein [Desulfurispirillum indicum]|uniref:histidine kinase n=1 Tax=Desulfurispirillum indicum (strain ATCC BAA-1389 / DSM 22839 / S5) TaxID=653733 RepID=E6W2D5_DESIS|nr:ATP-binding protein [Desulfurispirillum indicum]ADU66685.1 ATP-binding region ATPase domain protein [Desulfurispirillum indicum S5]UCZ56003.1 HAMP domain-containing protein [Desulfurispirillum indicum]
MKKRTIAFFTLTGLLLISLVVFNAFFVLGERGSTPSISFLSFLYVNFFLCLVLAFLVFRNFVKLLIERRSRYFGARFQTRLVLIFTALPLFPTVFLFFLSSGIVSTSIEKLINENVEQSLEYGISVVQMYYDRLEDEVLAKSQQVEGYVDATALEELSRLDGQFRQAIFREGLSSVVLFNWQGDMITFMGDPLAKIPNFWSQEIYPYTFTSEGASEVFAVRRLLLPGLEHPLFLLTSMRAPEELSRQGFALQETLKNYKELTIYKNPMKVGYYFALALFSMLVLFGSMWAGMFIARRITVPIQELAEATRQVAEGNMNVQINVRAEDEISVLVDSFNRMIRDLRRYKEAMESNNRELIKTNIVLEEVRRFQDVLLKSISTGVVSIDGKGEISFINDTARQMLGINKEEEIADDILQENYPLYLLLSAVDIMKTQGEPSIKGEVEIMVNEKKRNLIFESIALYTTEEKRYIGEVIVFDDMSAVVRSQKAMAWRDVAKRIAHEIRNPLTPIKLNAERLLKKYDTMDPGEFHQVLERSCGAIIDQVDTLRMLVDEFSQYARMPRASRKPESIVPIVERSIELYRNSHPAMTFKLTIHGEIPLLMLDKEQVSRVMVNLLENAVFATADNGQVDILIERRKYAVELKVCDSGGGIPEGVAEKIFSPTFSTNPKGSGLGLAIVQRIVEDHSGVISVSNEPQGGACFTIEFPISSSEQEQGLEV